MTRHVTMPRDGVSRSNLSAEGASASAQVPLNENHSQSSSTTGTLTPDSQQSELFKMADALGALNHGCLRQITEETSTEEQPIVQCVQIKPMASQNGAERYRVVMSDSINFMQGMLGQRTYT